MFIFEKTPTRKVALDFGRGSREQTQAASRFIPPRLYLVADTGSLLKDARD